MKKYPVYAYRLREGGEGHWVLNSYANQEPSQTNNGFYLLTQTTQTGQKKQNNSII